jgi:3-methylcrotonyl-CoA carboxylase beta subunit
MIRQVHKVLPTFSVSSFRHRSYHNVLPSLVSTSSPDFLEKAAAMDVLVSELEDKLAHARLGGGPAAMEKMHSKGKKIPRERLALLLDSHSPFLELSPLAAYEVYPGQSTPGAGLITGIGRISGRECMVIINDATVKGGSYMPLTVCRTSCSIPHDRLNI